MSREAKVLRTEILEARREIDRLSSKLLQLEERLTQLEDQGGFELVSSAEETVNKEDTKARGNCQVLRPFFPQGAAGPTSRYLGARQIAAAESRLRGAC